MAKPAKGMSTTLTRARVAPSRKGGVVEAMKSRAAAVGESRMIPVGDIQPNPDNPAERSRPGEGLVASIREVGVIQDLVLVPLELWRASHPEHEEVVTDAPYVVLAGHRRLAAAAAAARDEVPARVREDFDPTTLDSLVVHENIHREALTPIEEAMAYRRIMERQSLSQRALAKHTGVSQSQISKKLKLLELPSGIQELVGAGLLGIEESATVLDEDPGVVQLVDEAAAAAEEEFDLTEVITQARYVVRVEAARTAATEQAEQRGAPFVASDELDAHLKSGAGRAWNHRLDDDKAIAQAQEAGTLVVSHSHVSRWGGGGKVEFYTTEKPKKAPASSQQQEQAANDTQRRKANKARRAAMLDMVTKPPKADVIRRGLLAWAIGGAGWGSDTMRVAQPLLEHAELVPPGLNYWDIREHLRGLDERAQLHAAWVLLIAKRDEEVGLPQDYRKWGQVHLDHYAWLDEQGYDPTPWEQDKLAEARETVNAQQQEEDTADD